MVARPWPGDHDFLTATMILLTAGHIGGPGKRIDLLGPPRRSHCSEPIAGVALQHPTQVGHPPPRTIRPGPGPSAETITSSIQHMDGEHAFKSHAALARHAPTSACSNATGDGRMTTDSGNKTTTTPTATTCSEDNPMTSTNNKSNHGRFQADANHVRQIFFIRQGAIFAC